MLDKVPAKFLPVAKLILIIGSFLHLAVYLITSFAGLGSEFMPVVSNLILLSVTSLALAAVPVLLLIKKDNFALIVFLDLTVYFLISNSRSYIGLANGAVNGQPGLLVATYIFCFLFGLALLVFLAFAVIAYVLKKGLFLNLASFVLLGVIVLAYVVGIFMIVVYAQGNADWTSWVSAIEFYFFFPITLSVGMLYFYKNQKNA